MNVDKDDVMWGCLIVTVVIVCLGKVYVSVLDLLVALF